MINLNVKKQIPQVIGLPRFNVFRPIKLYYTYSFDNLQHDNVSTGVCRNIISLRLKHENIVIVWRLLEVTLMSNNSIYFFFLSSLLLLISLDIVLAWKHAS